MNTTRTILLVEDNDDVRQVFIFMLNKIGYEVAECRNGTEALKALKSVHPFAAIIDLNLPDMNGFDVIKGIREIEQAIPLELRTSVTPLVSVALSGHATDEQRRLADEAGFDLYFVKPVEMEKVCDEIEKRSKQNSS